MAFKHKLGMEAKDKITGFKGILTSRAEFLTGCNRYCVQPTELKDHSTIDPIYFDEDQLEIIGNGILPEKVTGKKGGACAPDAHK